MRNIFHTSLVLLVLPGLVLSGCAASSPPLALEEHPLSAAPSSDQFSFQPVQGTQEDVLAVHAAERSQVYSIPVSMVEDNPAITSLGENEDLVAELVTSASGPEQTVRVLRGSQVIFETSAGMPSPVLPLQGLWSYDGHWALEILYADENTWAGQVFIDGKLINKSKKYDEAFGFQLLAGKPFFFFSRNGKVGYSYDGRETDLGYGEIPHYRCCSESVLNPVQAQNMVAYFAVKEKAWFYVELVATPNK